MKRYAFLAAAALIAAPTFARADDALASARAKLIQAYDQKDYKTLCELLSPNASFRGSVKPDTWTIGRDAIIVQRWGASADCAGQARQPVRTFSVPTHTLVLQPDSGAGVAQPTKTAVGSQARIATDFGTMGMIVRQPGSNVPEYHHHYVMIWEDDGSGWKLTHVDMYAP